MIALVLFLHIFLDIFISRFHIFELIFSFKVTELSEDHLVYMHIDDQDWDVGVFERFHVRGIEGLFSGRCQNKIDMFLVGDHFLQIILDIHKFISIIPIFRDFN